MKFYRLLDIGEGLVLSLSKALLLSQLCQEKLSSLDRSQLKSEKTACAFHQSEAVKSLVQGSYRHGAVPSPRFSDHGDAVLTFIM